MTDTAACQTRAASLPRAHRLTSFPGERYGRIARRRGKAKAKAKVAVARSIPSGDRYQKFELYCDA